MSVYNGGDTIHQAIESILTQSFTDFEFLIVDDSSTDRSRDAVLSYADPRVRLLRNERNIGLTRSLNRGLQEARGSLIARMDADDVCFRGRLEAQVHALESTGADVCFCACQFKDEDTGREWVWSPKAWSLVRWRGLVENGYGIHPAAMFKRDSILRIGGYDSDVRYAQDYDLWSRCDRQGLRFAYVKEPLMEYRLHGGGISKRRLVEQERYARATSHRALREYRRAASEQELDSLRLLLRRLPMGASDGCSGALSNCLKLIHSFCETLESTEDHGAVWRDAAVSLAQGLPSLSLYSDKLLALRLILLCLSRATRRVRTVASCVKAYNSGRQASVSSDRSH
jgi:glycosyltransferase involved in cell wall biosynthesis